MRKLVEDGYYDGMSFYRAVEEFVAVTGDPTGEGACAVKGWEDDPNCPKKLQTQVGNSKATLGVDNDEGGKEESVLKKNCVWIKKDEKNKCCVHFDSGFVGMTRAEGGRGSTTTQWFIVLGAQRNVSALDGPYPLWGKVFDDDIELFLDRVATTEREDPSGGLVKQTKEPTLIRRMWIAGHNPATADWMWLERFDAARSVRRAAEEAKGTQIADPKVEIGKIRTELGEIKTELGKIEAEMIREDAAAFDAAVKKFDDAVKIFDLHLAEVVGKPVLDLLRYATPTIFMWMTVPSTAISNACARSSAPWTIALPASRPFMGWGTATVRSND